MRTDWPPVSVIVVTTTHHDLAEQAVASILAADYPSDRRQIIIIEETHGPQPIKGEGVEYHTIPVKNLGVGYARNKGLRLAEHDIVIFTDDDCTVEKDWLKQIVCPLMELSNIAAVAGAVLVPACGFIGQCENILGFPGGGIKYLHRAAGETVAMSTFSTCNCSINRQITDEIFFHEGFQAAGEDELLSRAISKQHRILYNPRAVVFHKPRDSFAGIFNWFSRRGQARVEMMKHAENIVGYLIHAVSISPIFRFTLVIFICLFFKLKVVAVLGLLGIIYYGSVLLRFRWARQYYHSWKTFLMLPIVKSVMDMGMDIGVLKMVVRKLKNSSGNSVV
jgi:GT2 family glycosyltransferase